MSAHTPEPARARRWVRAVAMMPGNGRPALRRLDSTSAHDSVAGTLCILPPCDAWIARSSASRRSSRVCRVPDRSDVRIAARIQARAHSDRKCSLVQYVSALHHVVQGIATGVIARWVNCSCRGLLAERESPDLGEITRRNHRKEFP